MDPTAAALGAGALIGLVLGLIGGGGSILATPLLVSVVGIASPHVAIGTGAVAVTLNALAGLAGHARAGRVKWPCAATFAASGLVGTLIGAEAGKAMDGARLLGLFGLLMVVIGTAMLRPRRGGQDPDVRLTRDTAPRLLPRLVPSGLAVGLLSGFFGIGGGFLIVPGLMLATRMPMANAVATSLVAVALFGAGTTLSYALSGRVDWAVAALMVAGGVPGAAAGILLGSRLAGQKRLIETGFALVVIAIGARLALGAWGLI
jgi:uncharacterized membrane protein YfcA